MYVHFKCGKCGKHLEVDEKGAGMSVPCTDCGEPVEVPTSTTKRTCQQCHVSVLVDDNLKGATFECSTCRQMVHIPSPDDVTEHRCPFCHIAVPVPVSMKGHFTHCPNCGQNFLVPGSSLHFQQQAEPTANPERLDLLTKASQWENRASNTMRSGERTGTVTQTGLSKINRLGGKIAGIPFLVGFAMQTFGFVVGIPILSDIGGILTVSGILLGAVFAVVYFLGLCIANPLKVFFTIAVAVTMILAFSNDGFRHWVVSAFEFDSPQNEMPLASSGSQYKETDDIQKHIGTADDSRIDNSRRQAAEKSEGYSGWVKEKTADSPDDLLAHARVLVGGNDPAAIPLLEKASRQGNADSSFELARIYAKGLCGVTTNENSMEQWLSVAQSQGHDRAGSMLLRRQQQTQRLDKTWRKYWDGESLSAERYLSADEIERGRREIALALQECTEASSWTKQQAQSFLSGIMACRVKTVGSGSRSGGQSRQPQADYIRPSGSPPRWQVREGQTRPDGVRTFNENQYIASHYGQFGGAFDTTRAARLKAEALNTQQEYNKEAMMEQAMNSGRSGVYMLNSRAGNWTYRYDETIDKFVVYQE